MAKLKKYKPYELYNDTHAVWYKKKPAHWVCERFKYNFREKKKKNATELPAGSISFGEVIFKNEDNLSQDTKESYQEVLVGEFLINPLNLNFDLKSLRTALSTINVVVSTGYIVLQGCGLLHSRFARWLLQQFDVSHMKTLGAGVRQTINYADIGNSIFCCPTFEEQKVIAAFLDHETAKIDNLIEKQQQLIELLREKSQAVISHAVTKGLNPDIPMKDSGVEWLGEVPAHWDVLRLKHLVLSLDSGCSVNAADVPIQQGQIGVLKTSCVYTRSFRPDENKTVVSEDLHRVKCPVKKGSIIISRMNTPDLVGASALVDIDVKDIYLPDRLWQTKFSKKFNLIPAYLANFMTIKGFRTQISLVAEGASSSMQNIAKEDYLGINCLLPPFTEQRKITKYLEDKLAYFADLELKASEAVQLLQERRTALISAAVTGKIDVRDWVAPDTQEIEKTEETAA